MRTCLDCIHRHITKDLEFTLIPHNQERGDTPNGKCSINIDLCWCDKPEVEDDDFQVLSFGKADKFTIEHWWPELASVCSDFTEKK